MNHQFDPVHTAWNSFREYERPVWITGGWALSLFAGKKLRPHEDIDVMIFLEDVRHLHARFTDSPLLLQNSSTGERSSEWESAHLVAGRDTFVLDGVADGEPELQVLLALSDESRNHWVFHRGNGSIRRAVSDISLVGPRGVKYLAPEVVLLFKSRQLRDKDTEDFLQIRHVLGNDQLDWLLYEVVSFRSDHPWVPLLKQSLKDRR